MSRAPRWPRPNKAMLAGLVILASVLAGALGANTLSPQEVGEGWILLYDGQTTFGWTDEGAARWSSSNGVLASDPAGAGTLRFNSAFANFILRFDVRASGEARGGLLFRVDPKSKPAQPGYRLVLDDRASEYGSASIEEVAKPRSPVKLGSEWHSFEIEADGETLAVSADGRRVIETKHGKNRVGHIVLDSGRGSRLEFRRIRLKPTGFDALFNGSNLTGWKKVGPAPPKKGGGPLAPVTGLFKSKAKEAVWDVQQGQIHGEKGIGRLESATAYDDFVLQVIARSQGKKKSAVFVRGDAGQLGSGYEVRIHNDFRGRRQPTDVGTGGLTGLQQARMVVSEENAPFLETIVARARHLAVWVNGYPVADFEDTRPEGASPRKEARTAPGTISFELFDEDARLDFKIVRIATLPKGPPPPPGAKPAPVLVSAIAPPPVVVPPPGATPAGGPAPPPVIIQPPGPSPEEQQKKAEESRLMDQLLRAQAAEEKKSLSEQIIKLNPNNSFAVATHAKAEEEIQKARAAQAAKDAEAQASTRKTQAADTTKREAVRLAEDALIANNLGVAVRHLDTVRRIDPADPDLQRLGGLVQERLRQRFIQRVTIGSLGGAGLLGGLAIFLFRRGQKDPVVLVVDGIGKGKKFNFDTEVLHLGAVPQDGSSRNEVVLTDEEHMISRFHCEIHRKGKKFFLVDCKSTNGTFLNGNRVRPGKPLRVKPGHRISLGGATTLEIGMEKRGKG